MDEKLAAQDVASAAMTARNGHAESVEAQGRYRMECVAADGAVNWVEEFDNLVTTVGKNSLLDVGLGGSAFTAYALGLVDGGAAPTYAAADTMASHAGWTENTGYSNATRPAPTFGAAAAGSKATTATAFTINATGTIAGAFLTTGTAKGGTSGTLYSNGSFSANRSVLNGDTLNVTYTATLT